MTADSNDLVLALLRTIRVDMGELRVDMRDVKERLTSLNDAVAKLHADLVRWRRTD